MNEFLYSIGIFIAGQVLHLFFWDFPNLRKSAKIGNVEFKPLDILKEDWYLWIGNILFGCVIYIISGEIKMLDTVFGDRPMTFYLLLGAFGSFSIQSKWGRLQAKIDHVIDHKTNIADHKETPPAAVEPPLTPEP